MPIHTLKLLDKREIARATLLFIFSKPDNFSFTPGQYGGFTLINPPEKDAGGITRRFSLLSMPDDDHIAIAIRMQNSAYKRVLKDLPIGAEIKFAGPTGNFICHEDEKIPAVFLAGGIGITPFFSIISHATKKKSAQPLYLFYGNPSTPDAALLHELTALQEKNTAFKFIPTFDQPDNTWSGEKGFISATMLKKYIPDLSIPVFYICGSPRMVTALQELLAEMGIDENKIKTEDFPGY